MANVFISYRKNDSKEAELLATAIQGAGHNVWFDEWNVTFGDSIIGRMNEGLLSANYVVVCYSSLGIDSPWMGREWMSALARQLNGHGIKLLPVILTGGKPPAILDDVLYVDLTIDWARGIALLLRSIK